MATFTPTLKEPRTGQGGGGGPHGRTPGGGGGGGRGDHDHNYGERLKRYRLGMAIGLAAVFMLFLSFTAAFLLREKVGTLDLRSNTHIRDWQPVSLPIGLLLFNTGLLILSSLTLEKSRRDAFQQAAISVTAVIPGVKFNDEKRTPWLGLTVLLGFGFLIGQVTAWQRLMARGIYLKGTPSSSFFYVMTAMHAVHLLGGILALLYATTIVWRSHGLDRRRVTLDVTALYWHSMTIIWVCILILLTVIS